MKLVPPFSLLSLAFAGAILLGCAAPTSSDDLTEEPDVEGVRMVGIGRDGEELPNDTLATSRPIHKHQAQASSSADESDPAQFWKSVQGPVPDPWNGTPPPPPPPPPGTGGGSPRP
jgi:hypothetical protein